MNEGAPLRARKVVVAGPMGAGKTTFSRTLSQAWGLPHIEVDAYSHAYPGNYLESVQHLRDAVRTALTSNHEGWLFDGTDERVMDIAFEQADTLIWLQMPFCIAYSRLILRTFKRLVTRQLLWGTHRDQWRTLLRWYSPPALGLILWRGHFRKTRGRILRAGPNLEVIILRSPGEVSRWLAAAESRPEVRSGD